MKNFFLTFFFTLSVRLALAQGGGVTNIRVALDKVTSQIVITYDLAIKGNHYDKYKVDFYYSGDQGNTFSETPLEYVTNPNGELNVGNGVSNGINKKVYWNYFVENADFDGKNLVVKIVAEKDYQAEENRIMGLGGPEKAFYSVVPGLGDYQVRPGKRYWLITAGVLTSLAAGIYFNRSAAANNTRYRNAEGNDFLTKARTQQTIGTVLLTTAATGWLTDIALVALKGRKNQRAKAILARKREEDRSIKPK